METNAESLSKSPGTRLQWLAELMTGCNKKMTFSQLKSPGVTPAEGEGKQKRKKEGWDKEKPGLASLAGPAWLYSESLRPVFPLAVGRHGNKAYENTTQAGREGISISSGEPYKHRKPKVWARVCMRTGVKIHVCMCTLAFYICM